MMLIEKVHFYKYCDLHSHDHSAYKYRGGQHRVAQKTAMSGENYRFLTSELAMDRVNKYKQLKETQQNMFVWCDSICFARQNENCVLKENKIMSWIFNSSKIVR